MSKITRPTKPLLPLSPVINCFHCKKEDLRLSICAKCRSAYYCSSECQRNNWPAHQGLCKRQANFMRHNDVDAVQHVERFAVYLSPFMTDVVDCLFENSHCVYNLQTRVFDMEFSTCKKELRFASFAREPNDNTKYVLDQHTPEERKGLVMLTVTLAPSNRCVSIGKMMKRVHLFI